MQVSIILKETNISIFDYKIFLKYMESHNTWIKVQKI